MNSFQFTGTIADVKNAITVLNKEGIIDGTSDLDLESRRETHENQQAVTTRVKTMKSFSRPLLIGVMGALGARNVHVR